MQQSLSCPLIYLSLILLFLFFPLGNFLSNSQFEVQLTLRNSNLQGEWKKIPNYGVV